MTLEELEELEICCCRALERILLIAAFDGFTVTASMRDTSTASSLDDVVDDGDVSEVSRAQSLVALSSGSGAFSCSCGRKGGIGAESAADRLRSAVC